MLRPCGAGCWSRKLARRGGGLKLGLDRDVGVDVVVDGLSRLRASRGRRRAALGPPWAIVSATGRLRHPSSSRRHQSLPAPDGRAGPETHQAACRPGRANRAREKVAMAWSGAEHERGCRGAVVTSPARAVVLAGGSDRSSVAPLRRRGPPSARRAGLNEARSMRANRETARAEQAARVELPPRQNRGESARLGEWTAALTPRVWTRPLQFTERPKDV